MTTDLQVSTRRHGIVLACMCIALLVPRIALSDQDLHIRIEHLSEQIDQHPGDYHLYASRGELYRQHEEFDAALADLSIAAANGPREFRTTADLFRGRIWLDSGRPDLALPALDRFVQAQPEHVGARVVRAKIHETLSNFEAAIWDYSVAIQVQDRPKPGLSLDRARVLANEKVNRPAESLRGIDAGVEKLGPLVTLLQFAIDLEAREQNYEAALRRVDSLSPKLRERPGWLVRRAELLQLDGRMAESQLVYRQALAAIEQLPDSRRFAKANVALEAGVARSLQLMAAADTSSL
jgi:tetratricopeptide (TPR) repeat protein